jgi:soluble lytic murein transglycosylase-like protein
LFWLILGRPSIVPADAPDQTAAIRMLDLLSATASPEAAAACEVDSHLVNHLAIQTVGPGSASPTQLLQSFLVAEIYGLRGESDASYALYESVIESAFRDDGGEGDAAAAKGLAVFSLLRAIRLLSQAPEPDNEKAMRLIDLVWPAISDRTFRGAFEVPVLGGFPRLEETLLREFAILAWSVGETDTAMRAFMKYLEVASDIKPSSQDKEITDRIIASRMTSASELALIRGKCFYKLRRFDDAAIFLNAALTSDDPEIRAEAGYLLARTRSSAGAPRKEVTGLLTAALAETADPDRAQAILFYRATVLNRDGPGRDADGFIRDMTQIIERFPEGEMADDALYEIARHYEAEGDFAEALDYFARLRAHPGPNNWLASSYYRPALILYVRHEPGDIEEAMRLLKDLVALNPRGDLSLASGFWLGRLASERGDMLAAREHFEHVIETCPYDYYAIRARMHLNMGTAAGHEVWVDPETAAELAQGSESGLPGTALSKSTSRNGFLPIALDGGLYAQALAAAERLDDALAWKLADGFTMEDLDSTGTYAATAVLMSLRESAIATATQGADTRDRLSIAASVGSIAGDWPLAMLLVFGLDRSVVTQSAIQHDPHYVSVAYPPVYGALIVKAGQVEGVPPELLYAVMRRESLFYPCALSNRGALGLFQFIPSTFETLNKRWDLLAHSQFSTREAFLSDPSSAISLGARWFREELLEHHEGDIPLAVFEHNAGSPAVEKWVQALDARGLSGDVEYMIESAGFTETRIFARAVLTDMVLARAIGLFAGQKG